MFIPLPCNPLEYITYLKYETISEGGGEGGTHYMFLWGLNTLLVWG